MMYVYDSFCCNGRQGFLSCTLNYAKIWNCIETFQERPSQHRRLILWALLENPFKKGQGVEVGCFCRESTGSDFFYRVRQSDCLLSGPHRTLNFSMLGCLAAPKTLMLGKSFMKRKPLTLQKAPDQEAAQKT